MTNIMTPQEEQRYMELSALPNPLDNEDFDELVGLAVEYNLDLEINGICCIDPNCEGC